MASKQQTKLIKYWQERGYFVINLVKVTPSGLPDLIAIKPSEIIFIESKEVWDKLSALKDKDKNVKTIRLYSLCKRRETMKEPHELIEERIREIEDCLGRLDEKNLPEQKEMSELYNRYVMAHKLITHNIMTKTRCIELKLKPNINDKLIETLKNQERLTDLYYQRWKKGVDINKIRV